VLLAVLVLQSFAITTGSESIVHDVMATLFGMAIFLVVFERSALQIVMAVSLLIALSIGWERHLHVSSIFDHALRMTQAVSLASFYWVVVWAILRNLFRTPVIGADNVFGAICGYLIAGQGWAHLNALAYLFAPSTYLFDPNVMPPADWHGRTALFAYYSYAQMLTIGRKEPGTPSTSRTNNSADTAQASLKCSLRSVTSSISLSVRDFGGPPCGWVVLPGMRPEAAV
jgi:hypothetical protein